MLDKQYWRAVFDEQRDAFVVEHTGRVDDQPQIEYRFTYFSKAEDPEIARLGGIDKGWLNDDGFAEGEFFAFDKYPNQQAFDNAVASICSKQRKSLRTITSISSARSSIS